MILFMLTDRKLDFAGDRAGRGLLIERLQLTYTKHCADLDYTVEATSDLASGPWIPIATNSGPLSAETTVSDSIPLTPETPRRFLRLRGSER